MVVRNAWHAEGRLSLILILLVMGMPLLPIAILILAAWSASSVLRVRSASRERPGRLGRLGQGMGRC